GKYNQALALQAQAVAQFPNDNDLLYDQAMLADRAGQQQTMERLLRQLIARQPDYHHAYNALGYSLAERGVRLQEAKELIEKALTYAPDDPFITDSLGWVEFRLGNHAQALLLLERAFEKRQDADIAAHLGEVLWKLGQHERAKALWKDAQQQHPDNETLRETLKRLGVAL
ncbi:MAG: tetratricopeptide repeat protein, partial [Giesbergeria sp.]|nr:tetratricopeptide repeat protein [Giesbergeria sp.]